MNGQWTIGFPHPPGAGGPGSFQRRLENLLHLRGWRIVYADQGIPVDIVFIVGGTRKISWLIRKRLEGVPVLYRLDGINWLHRKFIFGVKEFFLGESRNLTNRIIHSYLSDRIVYQSKFVRSWWDSYGLRRRRKSSVIMNGVDVNLFKPADSHKCEKIICLEGTIDYTPYSIRLLNELADKTKMPIHLYGGFIKASSRDTLSKKIHYHGKIKFENLPSVFRDGIFLSLDLNPACPNTVIEALASGLPVVAFDTGAISEIVTNNCGRIVPYGSDPWRLWYPDVNGMINSLEEIVNDYDRLSINARNQAVRHFDINGVVEKYEHIFLELIEER